MATTLQLAEEFASFNQAYKSVLVATFSALVAEFFQTLDTEVRFIWGSRTSLAKLLYFANRYTPIVNVGLAVYTFVIARDTSARICFNEYLAISVIAFLEFEIAFGVLCIRAYAAWEFSRAVLVVLLTSFVASFSGEAYVLWRFLSKSYALPPGTLSDVCTTNSSDQVISIDVIILVIVDSLALALLLAKSWTNFRSSPHGSSLLTVMAKDGIWYFACVIALSVANVIVLRSASIAYRAFFLLTQAAFQNALCVRLLLHLRLVNEESEPAISTVSSLKVDVPNDTVDTSTSTV